MRVYITKTGFRATRWDGETRSYVDKPISHIFHELRTACYIEDGVTLGDINEKRSELLQMVEEIDSGTAKLVPWEPDKDTVQ